MCSGYSCSKKVDDYLAGLNQEFPETLDYYRFPREWEEKGVAKKIREYFHVGQAWDNRCHTVKELVPDDDEDQDDEEEPETGKGDVQDA